MARLRGSPPMQSRCRKKAFRPMSRCARYSRLQAGVAQNWDSGRATKYTPPRSAISAGKHGIRVIRRLEPTAFGVYRNAAGAWRSLVAHLLWEQRVACSNHAAPTPLGSGSGPSFGEQATHRILWGKSHARTNLSARQKCHAVRQGAHQKVGSGIRTGDAARNRAADGLDLIVRHAPADRAGFRY